MVSDDCRKQGFVECETCAAKPGTPVLCSSCLSNRSVISRSESEIKRLKACVSKAADEGPVADRGLRQLLTNISRSNKELSILEVMWWIRTNTANQAEMPQAIFRVGDQLASVLYLEWVSEWEVKLNGHEYQFDTFKEVLGFIEQCREQLRPELDKADDRLIQPSAGKDSG